MRAFKVFSVFELLLLDCQNLINKASNSKQTDLAHTVGYPNGANFSNAFSEWVGVRLVDHREGRKDVLG